MLPEIMNPARINHTTARLTGITSDQDALAGLERLAGELLKELARADKAEAGEAAIDADSDRPDWRERTATIGNSGIRIHTHSP
jgi:hypothetical protein